MRNNRTIATIFIFVLVGVLSVAGYFILNKEEKTVISEIPPVSPTASIDGQVANDQSVISVPPDSSNIPEETPSTTKTVSLGDEITLGENETVVLNQPQVSVKIVRFINSPCPSGVQCIWNGQAVSFELKVGDKVYQAPLGDLESDSPYNVTIKSTDYKTFATFVISSK